MRDIGDEIAAYLLEQTGLGDVARDQQAKGIDRRFDLHRENPARLAGQRQGDCLGKIVGAQVVEKLGLTHEMIDRSTGAENTVDALRGPVTPLHMVEAVKHHQAVGQQVDGCMQPLELGRGPGPLERVLTHEAADPVEGLTPGTDAQRQFAVSRQPRPVMQFCDVDGVVDDHRAQAGDQYPEGDDRTVEQPQHCRNQQQRTDNQQRSNDDQTGPPDRRGNDYCGRKR